MNPTQSDIAAAHEICVAYVFKETHTAGDRLVDEAEVAGTIACHNQRERELLCELADMDCFQPWGCFCARLTGGEKPCIVCRARQWKKEQGL